MQDIIRESLSTDIPLLDTTNRDILSHGGKMLRPMVSMLMAIACSGRELSEENIRCAAASELLHNATLLHDDVADESDTRRGYPTVRAGLGPSASVLVGDYWLSSAVRCVLDISHRDKVVDYFSKTMTNLAEGELLQLEKARTGDTTEEDYLRIIFCKTTSLFKAACLSGAITSDAPDEYVEAAGAYATALGNAFQIKDDILDYDGKEELGKPVGIDLMEQKITLPLLGALKNAPDSESRKIRNMVVNIYEHPEYCDEIRAFVVKYDGLAYATARLEQYVEEAVAALAPLPNSVAKTHLEVIARFNSYRRA